MNEIIQMQWVAAPQGLALQYRQRCPVFFDGAQVGWGPWGPWQVPNCGPGVLGPVVWPIQEP